MLNDNFLYFDLIEWIDINNFAMNGFNKIYEVEKNGKKDYKENCVSNFIDFSTIHSCKLEIDIAALLFGEKRSC